MSEPALNLQLMRLIDEQFVRSPFCGWRKMTAYLRRLDYAVHGKRVRRLLRLKPNQFWHVNQYEQGGSVVVDLVRLTLAPKNVDRPGLNTPGRRNGAPDS